MEGTRHSRRPNPLFRRMVRWSPRLTSPGRKHGRRDAVEDALHPSVVEEYFMAGRRTSFRCHHTRAGAPHSRPVPLPSCVSSIFLSSSSPPFPSTHSTCLPINFDLLCINLYRPLSPPPSYLTPWGRSPSCPPCLLGMSFLAEERRLERIPTPPD